VVALEVAPPPPPPPPVYYGPPPGPGWHSPYAPYAPPAPGFRDPDVIVADYSEGHDVRLIAGRHGLTVEQVYAVVHQALGDSPGQTHLGG
jgi:hypothetical protein